MSAFKKVNMRIQNVSWNKRLEIFRTINGWSRKETAEKCGTSKRVYWNWENGKNYPIKNNRRIIAKVFEVDESDIFASKKP